MSSSFRPPLPLKFGSMIGGESESRFKGSRIQRIGEGVRSVRIKGIGEPINDRGRTERTRRGITSISLLKHSFQSAWGQRDGHGRNDISLARATEVGDKGMVRAPVG